MASRCANDEAGVRRCLEAAAQLSQTQSDSEAHFRLLVSIGTALSPPAAAAAAANDGVDEGDDDGNDDGEAAADVAQSLDLENFLHWCQKDGTHKTQHCSQLLSQLLVH